MKAIFVWTLIAVSVHGPTGKEIKTDSGYKWMGAPTKEDCELLAARYNILNSVDWAGEEPILKPKFECKKTRWDGKI